LNIGAPARKARDFPSGPFLLERWKRVNNRTALGLALDSATGRGDEPAPRYRSVVVADLKRRDTPFIGARVK
jgi:hypothetical protein